MLTLPCNGRNVLYVWRYPTHAHITRDGNDHEVPQASSSLQQINSDIWPTQISHRFLERQRDPFTCRVTAESASTLTYTTFQETEPSIWHTYVDTHLAKWLVDRVNMYIWLKVRAKLLTFRSNIRDGNGHEVP